MQEYLTNLNSLNFGAGGRGKKRRDIFQLFEPSYMESKKHEGRLHYIIRKLKSEV